MMKSCTFLLLTIVLPVVVYSQQLPEAATAAQSNAVMGPIVYGSALRYIYRMDLSNCSDVCIVAELEGFFGDLIEDFVVLPNGDLLVALTNGLYRYALPNNFPIWSSLAENYWGAITGIDGNIYLSRVSPAPAGLVRFNPANNTTTFIGAWPPNMVVNEFFYQNGVLYAPAFNGSIWQTVQVNLAAPDQTTILHNNTSLQLILGNGMTNGGYNNMVSFPLNRVHQYNAITNTQEFKCQIGQLPVLIGGVTPFRAFAEWPAGVPEPPCLCFADAGTINPAPLNLCVNNNVIVPYNNNGEAYGPNILRYIIFSDPNDTLGSIVAQSAFNSIPFNPATMQTGVTYYVATMAGRNLGGNVDPSDPCIDFSNAATLVWRPRPAVTFSADNQDVCPGDCRAVTANFTGTPSFSLNYTTPSGNFTRVFPDNTGTFQVCLPSNVPPGSIQVNATALTDAFCTCQ